MELEVMADLIARHSRGQTVFIKGERFSAPDGEARELLQKFPKFVRPIATDRAVAHQVSTAASREPVLCEEAIKPDGSPLTPIYWERGDRSISGPASVEFFYRLGSSDGLIVAYEEELIWINAATLRSKQQWAKQKPVVEVDRDLLKA